MIVSQRHRTSQLNRIPQAIYKRFQTRTQAEAWISHSRFEGRDGLTGSVDPPESVARTDGIPLHASSEEEMPWFARLRAEREQSLRLSFQRIQSESKSEVFALSYEQQEVLDTVKAGANVFFTGAAGTGKSVHLREIIRWCMTHNKNVGITASTGVASIQIGGQTLHSWTGIGQGKEDADRLVGKILGQDKHRRRKEIERRKAAGFLVDDAWDDVNDTVVTRWREVDVLVIDESECANFRSNVPNDKSKPL